MARYSVFAVWEIDDDGKVPRGGGALDGAAVRGLEFSYAEVGRLSALLTVRADSEESAVALAAGRVALGWQFLHGTPPGVLVHSATRRLGPVDRVVAGLARPAPARATGPQRWPDAELWTTGEPGDHDDRDDPDDGGLAGVREPRRPKPGPGHLSAVADPPDRSRAI